MGIQGLLPLLKSIMKPVHIKDLEGCCVAVDTYSWLHKGALSCSTQLCKGLPTTRHIEYCMHRVNLLRHYGVKPILVFDGGLLPMKIEQENKRARSRKENLARAVECESDGNSSAAYEFYQKAVDISPAIAYELIQVLKQENVCYVVAPYEADAQMTFLAISNQVDAVITEDSDLIAFGCPRIIFKMDKFGQGVEFQYSMLPKNKDLSFAGFTKQMLLEMCILSGCDYLPSLPGMGLKRAHTLISKFKSYEKVIKHLKFSTVSVPPLYEETFKKAVLTFQHQRVYDPATENIVHLSEFSDEVDHNLEFLGPFIPQHIAKGIAEGDLDPFTQLPFQGHSNISELSVDRKFELKFFKPEPERKKLDLHAQKNLVTKYFSITSPEPNKKVSSSPISPQTSPEDNLALGSSEFVARENAFSQHHSSVTLPVKSEIKKSWSSDVPLFSEFLIDDGAVRRSPDCTLLPLSGHKAGLALQKEHEGKNVMDAAEGKTRTENKKVIVRSRYFLPKQVNKSDQQIKQENFVVKDVDVQQKECETKNITDVVEGKTRIANRKVIVRSCYFKPKQVREMGEDNTHDKLSVEDYDATGKENQQEKLVVEDDVANCIPENVAPVGSFSSSHLNNSTLKRKISANINVQEENVTQKQIRTKAPIDSFAFCGPKPEKISPQEGNGKEKFGSNISHLGRYSEIAEKSVGKFVSMVSSQRNTSGSRVSGLRAPLKDVRSTGTNRSLTVPDFSQFAFAPKNRKSASASRKF